MKKAILLIAMGIAITGTIIWANNTLGNSKCKCVACECKDCKCSDACGKDCGTECCDAQGCCQKNECSTPKEKECCSKK